jgi:hypothetical protein
MWAASFGPPPEGLHLCHRCDERRCINLDHLFLGTRSDNMRDAVAKGRFKKTGRGSGSKLTEHAVREIRRHGLNHYGDVIALARFLGVTKGAILAVKHGRSWAWIR